MMDWVKANPMTVFLLALAFWVFSRNFGLFERAVPEDPASPIRHFTESTWQAEVLGSKKPVLVDFWASWCPPCRAQGPIVSDLAKALSLTAVVGKVDVQREGGLAARYGISGIPALLVFSQGRVVKQFTGLTSADALKQALADAAALPAPRKPR